METLPNRIRELRKKRGWSQERLAADVVCSKNQISDLELGQRGLTLVWMQRIAAALQVNPGDLLLKTDNPLQLTQEEQRLIALYRTASPETRETFSRIAEAMMNGSPVAREDALVEHLLLTDADEAARRA